MIFQREMVEKILAGEKTVTRRPVKYTVVTNHLGDYTQRTQSANPCRYEVGKTYAVQPARGMKSVGRIRILAVRRMELDALNAHGGVVDALREGFSSWKDFQDYWTTLYGSYDPTQLVDRIEFELQAPVTHRYEVEGGAG